MATQAQIDANRRNARKSTGPKTLKGKLVVSKNAVKHGMFSTSGLLLGEDNEADKQLYDALFAEFSPESYVEVSLVEAIILTIWRLRRIPRIEAGRHLWNRYAAPHTELFGHAEQQFRSKVVEALAREHGPASADLGPVEDIERMTDRLVKDALDGCAWQTDNSDLSRYEAKLDRRLRKLLADLSKYQSARKARDNEARNHSKSAKQSQFLGETT